MLTPTELYWQLPEAEYQLPEWLASLYSPGLDILVPKPPILVCLASVGRRRSEMANASQGYPREAQAAAS